MGVFDKKRSTGRSNSIESGDAKLILSDESPWPIQEAYKALRTNITFSLPGGGCKVIAVSSAQAHDGKSTICINTAISFAQLNKKVLLIECDLRLPTVGSKLGIKSIPGLSDLLVGAAQISEALRRNVRYGLDVLPAGNIPPDPTWLLQSNQMKVLIEQFRKLYDYIMIDLPPVSTVADASIISPYSDGFIVAVRHHVTERPVLEDTMAQLELANAKVLGFVYNDVTTEGGKYYKSYYKGYYKK
ncbi:MAG: CpsD/CapB family tyrosine-protein kinase [Eubacterium sp.]|nr:CpsD/CapB family tyrosine-protein kinase [Eubacterium sp.]